MEKRDDDPLKKLKEQQKGMVTCRICKGDHWTTKCPYKDTLAATTIQELEESGERCRKSVFNVKRKQHCVPNLLQLCQHWSCLSTVVCFQPSLSYQIQPLPLSPQEDQGEQRAGSLVGSTSLRTSAGGQKEEGETPWLQDLALEMVGPR